MAKKTCLFDIGRVLVEWHPEALLNSFLPAELPDGADAYFAHMFSEWNKEWDRGSFEKGIAVTKKEYPEYGALMDAYNANWLEYGLGKPIDYTVEIMKMLKAEGHRLIAASNFASDTFELARKEGRMDFVDLFDELHVSGFIGTIKPDPAFFTTLLDKFDVDPKEAIFTDDLQDNIDAAQTCGIEGILFTSAKNLRAELIKRGYLQ